ncbi:MAG TPA: hypothetical protein PLE24_03425 [Chitinispirillaceae bacterium]|jgi:lauroyl/myristoyl acyltransferase|nr:hypothetical protein [Chitinispirillaceae bacterium]
MSLSRYIQSPELLRNLSGRDPEDLKKEVLDRGNRWYSENPGEVELIMENLRKLGIPFTEELIEKIKTNVILHYYEKLLPLCGGAEFYHSFLKKHVDCTDAAEFLRQSIESGNGILLTVAHFGAVEFLVPSLSTFKIPINTALRFTTEQFSRMAAQQSKIMEESGLFGPIKFIEIGKPGTAAALEMAAALRRKEVLVSVFDEKTPYSKPVFLFGRKVYGGSGLDKLLALTNAPVDLFTAFMIRGSNSCYKLELFKLSPDRDRMLDMMYHHLENMVRLACEQWYFLHEEIPFV